MHLIFKYMFFLFFLFFCGCSYKQFDENIKNPNLPKNFNEKAEIKIDENWLLSLNDNQLIEFINKALNNNYELKKLFYDIKIKEQELISSNSSFFPTLDLSVNSSKDGDFNGNDNSSSSKISLDLKYELDIWGKLSDASKISNMNLLQTKALFQEGKQKLISDVAIAYFEIIEANNLLDLYEKNLETSKKYYDLIFSRYKQGISEALDTMLAKNSIFTQQSKIASLKTTKSQAIYKLEQLLGEYPKGKLDIKKSLPVLKDKINVGIPSQIIERKPTITASWNALLSKNYELAFTHKQRLPSFSISSSIENIKNDGIASTWSLLAGMTTPIFNAGKLKANEEIAYFELKKAELDYLDTLYNSFVEIESFLQEEKNLKAEYEILKNTKENAFNSLNLSTNQYLKGLVEYTTVLDSQESFYNSQVSLIQIEKLIIENRINLQKTLGIELISEQIKE